MKQYQITIEKLDGQKEIKNFDLHKDAMNKYRELKKGENEDVHIIIFEKIEDNINTILFTKKVCEKKIYKTCREIARNVDSLIDELDALKNHHEATIKISERKREVMLHLIRAVGKKEYQNPNEEIEMKIKLFNELAIYENKRTDAKNELDDIYNMQKSSQKLNVDGLLKERKKAKAISESVSVTRNKYERVVTYKDSKEKDTYIKQNKNYAYYIIDDYTSSIYFYNRFDGTKALTEFKKELKKTEVTKIAVKEIHMDTNTNNDSTNSKNVCENKSCDSEIKELEYRTIKQKGHYMKQYHKVKYKYVQDCASRQKLYFSNHPIDLDTLL